MNNIKVLNQKLNRDQNGIVLLTLLMTSLVLTFMGISLADLVIAQQGRTSENVFVSNALMVAEAGAEQTVFELNENSSFAGFDSETEFFNNDTQGRGTYQTEITNGTGPNERIIRSTGRVYRSTGDLVSERSIRVSIVSTASPGYSVHTGPGGLILGGSATITNSQVYVNGGITLTGAAAIGTPSQPLDVFVANANCPAGNNPGPSYPEVCASGEPISFQTSTRIYGNICATGQVNEQVAWWQNPPSLQSLLPGCTAPLVATPTYDRDAHIAEMSPAAGFPANDINYNCSQWKNPEGFVRTWPANLRLNGNVSMSSSCDLTITGDVYITGNLTIGGAARIKIADSLGTTRPVIMVDGTITAGGSATLISNSSGTSAHFVSMRSSAGCNPNCTDVTGTDLKNSQNVTTVDIAGAGNFPGTIFQAQWGKVRIGGSGTMGSAIGQTVDLSGAGTVVFGTTLATGDASWTVRSYQYDFE